MLNTNLFRMKRLFICFSMLSFAAFSQVKKEPISQPLITDQYSADPSAHLFKGKIYIYPSHDIDGVDAFTKNKHWGCNGPLLIDSRIKPHHAPVLIKDEVVEKKVDRLFEKGGSLYSLISTQV